MSIANRYVLIVGAVVAFSACAAAGELFPVTERLWKPVADGVYLQEVAQKIETQAPVTSLAAYGGDCYAVMDGKVYKVDETALEPAIGAPQGVRQLAALDGALWALGEGGLYRLSGGAWGLVGNGDFVDVCMHQGAVHAATSEDVYRYENGKLVTTKPEQGYLSSDKTVIMKDGTQILADPVRFGPIDHIASYGGTIYALRGGNLILFDGRVVSTDTLDWGQLPSKTARDLFAMGSRLFVTTDRGLAVVRGMAVTTLTGKDGLPYEDTTCMAKGFDRDLWIGTTRGAIRMLKDEYHYFGAYHWLPGDNVRAIAVDGHTVYIATDAGLGIIRYEPYTLRKKAAYYERHLEEWGHKRLGFIQLLYRGGENGEWIREVSDNDGGHTAEYLAAMSFKYAVTGDEADREAALDAFKAMIWLEAITPIDGFIARAIWSVKGDVGELSKHGSGGLPAKWYPTDDGLWYWKGDTSSDEVSGHFYSVSLFRDLAAQGAEKARAEEHITRMADHIMSNGWVLRDMDGQPTRWGRWDPDYVLHAYGSYERGLNCMQAQTWMRAAYGVSGQQRFEDGYQQLLDWGYHNYTVRQKLVFPPDGVVPWDDALAFRCYYTLLRYTDDPRMRSLYLRSLERSWEIKRMEHVAWYNFIYGAITGNDCETDRAVQYLREWTLDCIDYSYRNSHRADLAPEEGYVAYAGGTRGLSPRETSVKRGACSALPYDGNAQGTRVTEPTSFLQAYWMGRYHGFIEAPATTDPDLLTVRPRTGQTFGAKPYSGPPRPDNLIP